MMNTNFAMAIALGLFTVSASAPSAAMQPNSRYSHSVSVDLADIDLASESDREVLAKRIDTAVRKVCPARIEGPVKMYPDHRECRRQAREQVEWQMTEILARFEAGEAAARSIAVATPDDTRS